MKLILLVILCSLRLIVNAQTNSTDVIFCYQYDSAQFCTQLQNGNIEIDDCEKAIEGKSEIIVYANKGIIKLTHSNTTVTYTVIKFMASGTDINKTEYFILYVSKDKEFFFLKLSENFLIITPDDYKISFTYFK